MQSWIPLTLAGIGIVAIACQWMAWWARLPAILFLLIAGIVLGPTTGWLNPDALFGDLLFPIISLSVAIILFEGSLTLHFDEIRNLKSVVRKLISIGALMTWIVVTLATHWIFQLPWSLCILFGALMIVTGPTVIVPMLRTVRPTAPVASILRWEGIVIDPIGALLVVVIYEFLITSSQDYAVSHSIIFFAQVLFVGIVLGALAGWSLGLILKKHWLPEYLQNLATLSLVLALFALSNHLAHESGLLAVTVMGMWLANTKDVKIHEIINFKENLTILLISWLFILLAARLDLQQLLTMGWQALLLLAAVQLLARPLAVLSSTIGSTLSWRERILLCWIAPRGIVAAAVSALFAIKLEQAGFSEAQLLIPLTFIIIIGTVVLQSATARWLAQRLKVSEPVPHGFLMIGANAVARTIGVALKKQGIQVLLTDSNWGHIREARMLGLDTFYGNPVSDYADQRLELAGLGNIMALSPQRDLNVLTCMHYKSEFGPTHVFTLRSTTDNKNSDKHQIGYDHRGYLLFNEDMTYGKFASLLSQGAEIRSTKLTEEFSFADFKEKSGGNAIPLFAISPKGRLEVFVDGNTLQPEAGWQILSLSSKPRNLTEKIESVKETETSPK